MIDEDLGQSAAGTVVRSGFERLVAAVCLGEVGAVAARELSRFARNSREWQQLIEVCRVVDTILIDNEQVYSPRIATEPRGKISCDASCTIHAAGGDQSV